jgi:inhibitor of KinA
VGIAGAQTGIYPTASPGGWRLIGRTPVRLFDPRLTPPALLEAGDRVRFLPISASQYEAIARDVEADAYRPAVRAEPCGP